MLQGKPPRWEDARTRLEGAGKLRFVCRDAQLPSIDSIAATAAFWIAGLSALPSRALRRW